MPLTAEEKQRAIQQLLEMLSAENVMIDEINVQVGFYLLTPRNNVMRREPSEKKEILIRFHSSPFAFSQVIQADEIVAERLPPISQMLRLATAYIGDS